MPPALPLIGRQFGRLTVIEREPSDRPNAQWRCHCECGGTTVSTTGNLTNGWSRSCGCLQRESVRERSLVHGRAGTTEHIAWRNAKSRCYDPANKEFANYGARGITMCDGWRENFAAFLSDMGLKPHRDLTLERIDNDGAYAPGNCRWATKVEQGNNQRDNRRLTHKRETLTVAQWAKRTGIPYQTLSKRIRRGWQVDRALQLHSAPLPNTT